MPTRFRELALSNNQKLNFEQKQVFNEIIDAVRLDVSTENLYREPSVTATSSQRLFIHDPLEGVENLTLVWQYKAFKNLAGNVPCQLPLSLWKLYNLTVNEQYVLHCKFQLLFTLKVFATLSRTPIYSIMTEELG